MKKLTRILLVVLTLTIVATSVASCEFTDKITSWIDKVYDYIVTGCVHEGGAATCTEKAICSLCGRPYGEPLGHTPEAIPGIEPTCTESGITEGSRCGVCGEILESQMPLSPLGHSFGEWEVTTPATCTTDGESESRCATCGETHTETIKANGHREVVDTGKPATCTENGLTDGKHCSECNTIIVAQQTIQKTQHEYEDDVTAPKCMEQGYTTYTCKHCGDSYTSDYKTPTGHTFGEWEETTPATCQAEGVQTRKCACGATDTMPIAKKTHSYSTVVTAPTCTEMGYTTHTCSCGDSYKSDYKNPTGHSFGTWIVTTQPTCTAEGEQSRSCTHTGCKTTETMPVGAKGHNYVKNNGLSKTANCTEGGYDYFKCTRCDAHYTTNNTPANGHKYDDDYDATCNNCDHVRTVACRHTDKETITGTPATCTTTGLTDGKKCKDCGEILTAQTVIPAKGHDFESTGGKVVTDPTCTEAGYTTYTCQREGCTHSYKSDYTSATGHSWSVWSTTASATCTTDGEEKRTCGNCSTTETRSIGASGHVCEKTATKNPTCTEVGYDSYKCKNCDYNYKDNYKPALGHDVSWKLTEAPTCTAPGTITGVCTRSGCEESTGLTAHVEALGHTGGTATCKSPAICTRCSTPYGDTNSSNHVGTVDTTTWYHDASNHWNQYTCCGAHANENTHSVGENGTAAGCETKAACGTCGQQFGSPNGHDPKDGWLDDGEGNHYQACENCDKHINSTSHTHAETWSKDGDDHWHECECGAKNDNAAHTYVNGLCLCGALQPKTLRIETKADLLAFRDSVNGGDLYAGWTVYLINDIDLENADFGGIGVDHVKGYGANVYNASDDNAYFLGTFEGLGHTVKNFKITSNNDNGYATAGFFNSLGIGAHIKDLTVEGATINSTHYAGGIVGYWAMAGITIEGCHVKSSTIISAPQQIGEGWDNGDKVGGIVGIGSTSGSIKGCTVTDTTIKGYRNLGGIAGYLSTITVEDCSISGVTINVDSSHDYKGYGIDESKYSANSIVGVNGYATTNCTGTATINYGTLTCKHTNKETITGTSATCTESGLTNGEKCKDCGEILTAQTTLPATGHSYNKSTDWIDEVPANCTSTGTLGHYHCTKCNKDFGADDKELASLTIAVVPNAHKFGEWVNEVPATCTEVGTKGHKDCEYCHGHFDAEGNKITDLTINKLDHTYDQMVATSDHLASSATCEAKAKYYYSCTCGANGTTTFEHGDYAPHTVGTWVEKVSAKCDATGTKGHYVCSVCGKNLDSDQTTVLDSLTIDKDPDNHSGTLGSTSGVEGGYVSDAGEHWQVWSCCGVTTTKTAHTYDAAGNCVCGRVSHVHSFGEWIDEVPATCAAKGTKAHKTCSGCGKHFDNKDNEMTDLDIAIDTDAHTLVAVSGVTGLFHCDGCGKDFNSNTSWKLLTDASKLTAGSKIVIVATGYDYALITTQSSNNRAGVAITKNSDGTITINESVQIITVEAGKKSDTFAFKVESGYLYAASSSNNQLKTKTDLSDDGSWKITVDSKGVATIQAQGSNSRNLLRYNNTNKLFSCYAIGQENVSIYIQVLDYTEVAEHVCANNVTGATCTTDGTCSVCGRTVENSKTPHVYVDHFCTCGAEQPKMYLATSANWREAGAWFAARFWHSTDEVWERMTDDNLDGVYECYIPEGMTQVIILRKNPANQDLGWDGEWARVGDQTLPTNGNNCYKVVNWNNEESGWTTFDGGIWVLGTINATDPWATGDDRLMTFDSTTNLWTLVYNDAAAGTYEIKLKDSVDNWYGTAEGSNISVTVPSNHSKVIVKFSISSGVDVSVDAHAHDWTWVTTSTTHKQTCLCGDAQNEDSHSYTNGLCVCGAIDPDYYFPKNISDLGTLDDGSKVEFTGTVVKINTEWSTQYNNISVTVSDENGNTFYIYRLATNVALCDVITVKGEIGTYNGAKQIAQGATATIGAAKAHDWADATCTLPKTCKTCSATDGNALGHDYVDGVCSRCNDVEGKITTVTVSIADYGTNNSWVKETKYTSVILDSNITATVSGGANSGKYYSNQQWRLYQTESPTLTIAAAEGKTIVSVKITFTKNKTGCLTYNGKNILTDNVVSVNANSITFGVGSTGSNIDGQVRITSIEIVYQ